jgi:LysM repeat protein
VHAAPQATVTHGGTYTVRRGDTLGRIAKTHGTSVKALFDANRGVLSNPHVLRVGIALHV